MYREPRKVPDIEVKDIKSSKTDIKRLFINTPTVHPL